MTDRIAVSGPEEALLKRHDRIPEFPISARDTALLVIDMQYYDAHPDYGIIANLNAAGEEAATRYYVDRLGLVIRNIQLLLDAFRGRRMEVIHVHIQSLTKNGRDRSQHHKDVGIHCAPGSKEAEFLEELVPSEDEIVLSKTTGSAFNSTTIEYVLHNLGIRNLVVAGVVTNGCVQMTVRDAADRSFRVILVEDACGTWTEEMHNAAVSLMRDTHAKVKRTDEVLEMIQKVPA